MKPGCTLFAITLGVTIVPVFSQLALPKFLQRGLGVRQTDQTPILGPHVPFMGGQDDGDASAGDDLTIADVIGKDRSINIFAGFTRDIDTISSRLDDKSRNSTILAPTNGAIQHLPRKPWENPEDYGSLGAAAYKGEEGEDRAHGNLRRFVEAHVLPESPWAEGARVKSLGGDELWWETKDGKKLLQPGNIEISSVVSRVENGQVWVIKGVLNYSR